MADPVRAAQKWARNLAGAQESIRAGVEAVTESPMMKAAANVDGYLAGVQRAVSDGSFQRGLRSVTLEDWKSSMTGKGLQRISQGAQQGTAKMQRFLERFLPHLDALKSKLAGKPKGTLADALERVRIAMEHNAQFKGRMG